MQRIGKKRNCGTLAIEDGPTPTQDFLAQNGKIYSCGGVFKQESKTSNAVHANLPERFVFLPDGRQSTLVIGSKKIQRFTSIKSEKINLLSHGEAVISDIPLHRAFFKESLN